METMLSLNRVTKSQYKHFGGKIYKFAQILCMLGEAGTMEVGKNGKVGNQGVAYILLGMHLIRKGTFIVYITPEQKE